MPKHTTIALSCGGTIAGMRTDAKCSESLRVLDALSSKMRSFEGYRPISATVAVEGERSRFVEAEAPERVASAIAGPGCAEPSRPSGAAWDVFDDDDDAPTKRLPMVHVRARASMAVTRELPRQGQR